MLKGKMGQNLIFCIENIHFQTFSFLPLLPPQFYQKLTIYCTLSDFTF